MKFRGIIHFLLFLFFVGISGVYQSHLSQTLNPLFFLFFSTLTAILFYSIVCFKKNRFSFILKTKQYKRNLIQLNTANLLVWFPYVFALKYLEPALSVVIGNSVGPILAIIFSKIFRPQAYIYRIEKIAALGIFFSLLFIMVITLSGKSAINSKDISSLLIGVTLAVLTGIGQVFYSFSAKKFSDDGFLPSEIIAWRYLFVLILSFVFINKTDLYEVFSNYITMRNILFICMFGMIIPSYFYQKSLESIEPIFVSILFLIEPIIMFIAQIFDPRLKMSLFSYVGVVLICLFTILGILGRIFYQNTSRKSNTP